MSRNGSLNSESRKIVGVAIGAEVLIIGAGLSLAGAIGWRSFSEHHDIALAMSEVVLLFRTVLRLG